jgi:DNA-binding NarL/FixJ family response regulator
MPEQVKPKTIIIADDHPIFRQGLIRVIESACEQEQRYKVIAEAGSGTEALELIERLKPDVAIIDIDMPKMNGLEVVRKISAAKILTSCIIITMYKDEEYFNEAMELGVLGYLLKDGVLVELIECLDAVQEAKHFISPKISDYLISRNERLKALNKVHPELEKLTKTEMQILKLLSENKSSKRIAEEMFISEKTVENHRANICSKLGLKGRNSLLLFALQFKSHFG